MPKPQLLFNPAAGGEEFAGKATDGGLANMVMQSVSMCDKVRFRASSPELYPVGYTVH